MSKRVRLRTGPRHAAPMRTPTSRKTTSIRNIMASTSTRATMSSRGASPTRLPSTTPCASFKPFSTGSRIPTPWLHRHPCDPSVSNPGSACRSIGDQCFVAARPNPSLAPMPQPNFIAPTVTASSSTTPSCSTATTIGPAVHYFTVLNPILTAESWTCKARTAPSGTSPSRPYRCEGKTCWTQTPLANDLFRLNRRWETEDRIERSVKD